MFNLDDEQTALQTSLMDTDDKVTITPTENRNLCCTNVWQPSGNHIQCNF